MQSRTGRSGDAARSGSTGRCPTLVVASARKPGRETDADCQQYVKEVLRRNGNVREHLGLHHRAREREVIEELQERPASAFVALRRCGCDIDDALETLARVPQALQAPPPQQRRPSTSFITFDCVAGAALCMAIILLLAMAGSWIFHTIGYNVGYCRIVGYTGMACEECQLDVLVVDSDGTEYKKHKWQLPFAIDRDTGELTIQHSQFKCCGSIHPFDCCRLHDKATGTYCDRWGERRGHGHCAKGTWQCLFTLTTDTSDVIDYHDLRNPFTVQELQVWVPFNWIPWVVAAGLFLLIAVFVRTLKPGPKDDDASATEDPVLILGMTGVRDVSVPVEDGEQSGGSRDDQKSGTRSSWASLTTSASSWASMAMFVSRTSWSGSHGKGDDVRPTFVKPVAELSLDPKDAQDGATDAEVVNTSVVRTPGTPTYVSKSLRHLVRPIVTPLPGKRVRKLRKRATSRPQRLARSEATPAEPSVFSTPLSSPRKPLRNDGSLGRVAMRARIMTAWESRNGETKKEVGNSQSADCTKILAFREVETSSHDGEFATSAASIDHVGAVTSEDEATPRRNGGFVPSPVSICIPCTVTSEDEGKSGRSSGSIFIPGTVISQDQSTVVPRAKRRVQFCSDAGDIQ